MKNIPSEAFIQEQKGKVFGENPSVELSAPCRVGDGILRLDENERKDCVQYYNASGTPISFFIPSSGSGSRMFEFLYDFLESPNDELRGQVERFLHSISDFAFFLQIPLTVRQAIQDQQMGLEEIVTYLLKEEGLGYGQLPKGLIPFHSNTPFILNPFQEHLLQGSRLENNGASFHFTIQQSHEDEIRKGIEHVQGMTGRTYDVSFSEQAATTDSIAFTEDGKPLTDENGDLVTRPAGHGALLENLDQLSDEVIFIKNIDNVQHYERSELSVETWKMLGGLLLKVRYDAKEIFDSPDHQRLIEFNNKYQLYSDSELDQSKNADQIRRLLNRPFRVCGMVKNEGQPGGGPFWVNENGILSKQIVEKAQISGNQDQYMKMVQSTHFNPVMIALSPVSFYGEKFGLKDYSDSDKYFIVRKKYHGQPVRFMELPGLWNGGMAHWNTVFVEVPSATFTPVKTVLDLLGEAHRS